MAAAKKRVAAKTQAKKKPPAKKPAKAKRPPAASADLPSELVEALKNPAAATRLWLRSAALPAEVAELPKLTYLSAGEFGRPMTVPAELERLTELEHLDLCGDLEAIPALLAKLPKLRAVRLRLPNPAAAEALSALPALQDLQLSVGKWGDAEAPFPTALLQLRGLKKLVLEGPLASIPETFSALSDLELLELGAPKPWSTLPEAVTLLPKLRELKVRVQVADERLGRLRTLEKLSLRDTRELVRLPRELGALTRLVELDVGYDALEALPEEIGELQALKTLRAYGNQLTAVPKTLGRLRKLVELELNMNPLRELPDEVGELESLERLKLGEDDRHPDGLRRWPASLGKLKKLKSLWAPSGRLTALPAELGECSALNTLYVPKNQLGSVPPELGKLTELRWLSLAENPLSSLPDELRGCVKLEELDLTACSFPADALAKVEALKVTLNGGYRFSMPRLKAERPPPPANASAEPLSPKVLEQLARLGAQLKSPDQPPPRRKAKTKGGEWPIPEAMRQFSEDTVWPKGVFYDVTVGPWDFWHINFQIGTNLDEYECTFHRPFDGGTTDGNGNAIVWDLSDADPTDPQMYRVDHEGWREPNALNLGVRLSELLKKARPAK